MSHRLRIMLLAGLSCLILLPAVAQAGNFSFGYWPGYNFNYGHSNNHYRGNGYGHGNNYYRGNGYGHGNNHYNGNNYGGYNNHQRACHSVRKNGYDDYGNRVVIGGTQCYDRYGNPYIVSGSRHIIGYH